MIKYLQTAMLTALLVIVINANSRADFCGVPVTPRFKAVPSATSDSIRAFQGAWGDQNSKWYNTNRPKH